MNTKVISNIPLKIDNTGVKRHILRELIDYGRNVKKNEYYTIVKETLVDIEEIQFVEKTNSGHTVKTKEIVQQIEFWKETKKPVTIENVNYLFTALPDEITHANGNFDVQDLKLYCTGLLLDTKYASAGVGYLGTQDWRFLKED